MKTDRMVALAALAFAAIYYYFADEIPRSLLADAVGADGLPKAYAVALALLALPLLRRSFTAPADPAPEYQPIGALQHVRAIGLLALGVGYLMLVTSTGYLSAMVLLIAAVAWYCGAGLGGRLLVTSAVGGVFFWLVFVHMFNMPLPSGTLWRWLAG